jgi:DNA-binding transcriptional ArsR family regulator
VSTTALTWAFAQETGSPTLKAVLVALADQADDEAYTCYPGQELISERTELGERTVRRALKDLEDAGYIKRKARFDDRGHRTSDWCTLAVDVKVTIRQRPDKPPAAPTTGQADRRSMETAPPATHDSTTGQSGQVTVREPSGEPSVVPEAPAKPSTNGYDAKFDQFWTLYPLRVGKAAAKVKFVGALKRGISLEVLLAGVTRYRDDPNRDPAYTAHPATWLHQGRWDDEPLPARGARDARAPNDGPRRPGW